MIIQTTLHFKKAAKKFPAKQKQHIEDIIEKIGKKPEIGDLKKGDLAGVYVYKFKIHHQLMLLAYTYQKSGKHEALTLLSLSTHENFYRDLKR